LRRAFQDGVTLGMPFFEIPLDVFDRNRSVIHKNSDGEGQSSEGHDVDGFARKLRIMTEVKIDNGMEIAMIKVLRQLPKNNKIINPSDTQR